MFQRTRKLMTMHKALHDVDRLYESRKEGGRGIARFEDYVDSSKAWRKSDYNHQKQYWRHEDQQNENNENEKKKTLWTF